MGLGRRVHDLGYRVQGSGFRDWECGGLGGRIWGLGLGFRVYFKGLGFRVGGLGFRVWGLGFRVWGLGFRVVD